MKGNKLMNTILNVLDGVYNYLINPHALRRTHVIRLYAPGRYMVKDKE